MIRKLTIHAAAVALLAVAAAVPAAADLTVVSTVTAGKNRTMNATQYISAEKVRSSDGELDTIIDLATGKMIHVDHKKKAYYETSLEEMRAHFAELEKMMNDNPIMAQMMGKVTDVEVEKGSGTRTIAGYECEQYLLSMGEKLRFEIWATRDLETPIQYLDARKMAYAAMGPMASRFDKMYEEMKEIGGFPLSTKVDMRMMGRGVESLSEATEVGKEPIPAGTFDPPAGYKKKKSPFKEK